MKFELYTPYRFFFLFFSIRYLKINMWNIPFRNKKCHHLFSFLFFFSFSSRHSRLQIMAHYDLALNMVLHTVGLQLCADDWPGPGMWWVKPRGRLGPPLALSVLPAAGPEEPEALQLTLAEKHTSPVAQHNYFHMFVSPGRTKEQSPLFWKQTTLIGLKPKPLEIARGIPWSAL